MPLQGTIDSFPLSDVLSLLDSTSRVGRLSVAGDRNSGWVEMAGGLLIAGELLGSSKLSASSVLFELLRCTGGEFEFLSLHESELTPGTDEPTKLSQCLSESAFRLERWEEIEKVLPTNRHSIRLISQLPTPEILLDSFRWSLLVAIQGNPSVSEIVHEMPADELEVCSALAALITEGLAEAIGPFVVATDRLLEVESNDQEPAVFPEYFPIDDLVGLSDHQVSDPWHRTPDFSSADSVDPTTEPAQVASAAAAWDELVSPAQTSQEHGLDPDLTLDRSVTAEDDVYRQMSTLSPQAAEAIAAALSASPVLEQLGRDEVSGSPNTIVEVELAGIVSDQSSLDTGSLAEAVHTDDSPEVDRVADLEHSADAPGSADVDEPLGPISFIGSF